jgi:hypothetical protein
MKTETIILIALGAIAVFFLFGSSTSRRRGNQFGGPGGSQFAGVDGDSQFSGTVSGTDGSNFAASPVSPV